MTENNENHKLITASVIVLFACLANIPLLQTVWIHGFDDGTYSHAFLIPFISLYLFYTSVKERRVFLRPSPSILWLTLTLVCCVILYAAAQAQMSLGYWGAWLLMLCCAVPVIFRFSLTVIFPFAYLIFLLPVWGMLSSLLQTLSVLVVSHIMGLTGIPVYVESVFVQIPSGTFEIADGCSGLRYMIVSLAISSIYIFMFIRSTSSAIKLVLLSILGALVTNWVRIAALIVIGHITEMQSSLMEDHNMFGWYLYIPFMFIFYYVGNRLADTEDSKAPVTAAREDGVDGRKLYAGLAGIILFMGGAGTTLSHAVIDYSATPPTLTGQLQPHIFYGSAVEQSTASLNGNDYQKLSYYFDGKTLDGKPSYYENQLIPDGWTVKQQTISDGYVHMLLLDARQKQHAEVLYQYHFAGNTYARLGALKRARIQRALLSSANTQIDWLWRLCSAQCKDSLAPE